MAVAAIKSIQRRRAQQRKRDAEDLRTRRYTANELQNRNSWIPKPSSFVILSTR